MIHKNIIENESIKSPKTSIRWCSQSFPRPKIGIEGVLYVNRDKQTISVWDEINHKYIEFFKKSTNNESLIVKSNNNSYSFNMINDSLIITNSEGVILEINIPNKEEVDKKINLLEKRIARLEELFD